MIIKKIVEAIKIHHTCWYVTIEKNIELNITIRTSVIKKDIKLSFTNNILEDVLKLYFVSITKVE
tara:strand:+ start:218 stop:412 length:195 start_codon:yes stop_codon:yes gene_type:complete